MENQKFAMLEEKIDEIKLEIVESGLLTAGEEWNYKQVVSPFNRLYFILEGGRPYTKRHAADGPERRTPISDTGGSHLRL